MMMDACEIANFLATELFMQQLVPLDGIQSGVPTRTTPTLTPTTLRNIEQTLLDWSNDVDRPISTPCQAGFVPPLVPSTTTGGTGHFIDTHDTSSIGSGSESGSQNSWHTPIIHEENSLALTDTSSVATIYNSNGSPSLPIATSTATIAATTIPSIMPNVTAIGGGGSMTVIPNSNTGSQSRSTTTSKRNTGGRRPTKPTNLTPEEEEKRKIRRERNKLAAARCRKRRVDQTNELIEKVDQLEKEKQGLQQKIEELKMAADELEMCLTSHQPSCKLLIPSQPNHNNNNRLSSASPCDMKPIIMTATTNGGADGVLGDDIGILGSSDENEYELKSIKSEPLEHHHHNHNHHSMIDSLDDVGGPPSPKRIMLTANNPIVGQASITPPLPNVSTISSTIAAAVTSILNTPTITTPPPPSSSSSILTQPTVIAPPVTNTDGATGTIVGNGNVSLPLSLPATTTTAIATTKPNRPSSLNVPLTITPSQSLGLTTTTKNVSDIIGVPITTPSSGVTFNFDSLMDGGTGLTPVTAPLIPTCSSQNSKQNPLDLITPTSESSKLVSL